MEGLSQTRKHEQTREAGGILPRENVRLKSSEKARNAPKNANYKCKFAIITSRSYNQAPTVSLKSLSCFFNYRKCSN